MTSKPPRRYQQQPPGDDWLGGLAHLQLHFGRFLRGALGTALIAVAVLSLVARWGLSGGVLLTPWSSFLATWLGWGTYLLVCAIAYGGIVLIRRAAGTPAWSRLIALEVASLLGLGILSILGGNSLMRADAGMDGGRLGWGIAYLPILALGPIGAPLALSLILILLGATGFGLWGAIERRILRLAGAAPVPAQPAANGQPELERTLF